ncbi:MAG TPA: hypothetical protein VFU86_04410 [Terriglobales bacterium]|nr:hypothetical protein [Terriglobales bacterium]
MRCKRKLAMVTAAAVLAILVVTVICAQNRAQNKYSVKTASGIAFSDFRGYGLVGGFFRPDRRSAQSDRR